MGSEKDRRSGRGREPLDRSTIVAGAVALADEEGIELLTMRRLAERLGYAVMALYNHVRTKEEVLALMVDAVAAEVPVPDPALPGMAGVRRHALETRAAFVRHPWAPGLWQRSMPGPARVDHMEGLLGVLARSGLPAETAHHGFHAVNNHVLGYTLQELAMASPAAEMSGRAGAFLDSVSGESHPLTVAHVREHLEGRTGSSFELVLDLILDGLWRSAEPASDAPASADGPAGQSADGVSGAGR